MNAGFIIPSNGKVINDTGDSPYHLVVKSKVNDSRKAKVCTALSTLRPLIDPTVKDRTVKKKEGKQAKEYVTSTNKELCDILLNAEKAFMLSRASHNVGPVSTPQSNLTSSLEEQMKRVLSPNYLIRSDKNVTPLVHAPCDRSRDHIQFLHTFNFESYPWAIEATPQVFKMLKVISYTPECYVSIVKGLADMGKGSLLHELKPINSDQIGFYQTTIEGCHFLWEKAIQYFSFKKTEAILQTSNSSLGFEHNK